ncbi:MAG: hypothetical protein QF903_06065 [Planctomycetota bacterium]|nr:hypothetical protein [Planctomycetota bacterium]MDP6763078.1 hypothetical protein [Planctomycetota bacterium]MDP6989025.1 hypothetical protein [Planctomycetota bacterium]
MKLGSFEPPGAVVPPSVVAATVALGLFSIWYVWLVCTLRFPTIASGEPWRLLSARELGLFSIIDACLVLGLVFDAWRLRSAPPGLLLAQRLGLGLTLLVVVLFQVWVVLAYGPIRAGQG